MIRLFLYLISLVITIELIGGYLYFIDQSLEKDKAFDTSINKISKSIKSRFNNKFKGNSSIDKQESNCKTLNSIYEIYNPKSDALGAHLKYEIQFSEASLDEAIINSAKENNYTIVLLGGSEMMGYSHPSDRIHTLLQDKLRKHFKSDNINVVNAANAGAFIKDEIYIFHDLNNIINTNMVIQHTGFNDSAYISDILGEDNTVMNYSYKNSVYGYVKHKKELNIAIDVNGKDSSESIQNNICTQIKDNRNAKAIFIEQFNFQIDHFIKTLKFMNIAHIIGIQGYDETKYFLKNDNPIKYLHKIEKDIPGFINLNSMNNHFDWYDSSHTTQETAHDIADIYKSIIVSSYSKDILKTIK